MRKLLVSILVLSSSFAASSLAADGFTTVLRSLGHSLIPAPQQASLDGGRAHLDGTWTLASELSAEHIAVRTLVEKAEGLHGLDLKAGEKNQKAVVLRVAPGTVRQIKDPALAAQAYRLEISEERVAITGNTDQGLFYGVQSFLQLLRADNHGGWTLPTGTITDWPALELRFIHWDTKHHQKRPETLKRLIDWLAFFKVNCIGFEMEDKYEYPSHPVIGAPGAYTKQQMQELTRYALERHIQLVPVIQSPAHMAYVLKHDRFAHLRSDGSNYQACMCSEEAMKLIEDMYADMIEATPGVKYFHVSTDEIYFAGICDKCPKPYNDQNRSQAWVDFVKRMHAFLAERGRRMLCWVEYPLLAEHISQLPPDLIDGVMGRDRDFIVNEAKVGIRQLAYSSIQGSEKLFPNYLPTTYRGRRTEGNLKNVAATVTGGLAMGANLIGSFAAAWDDSGLHEECFWLGWATVTQYAWTPEFPPVEQSVADFMDAFYGPGHGGMVEIYRSLEQGARFFESSLDKVPSAETPPAYGNPWGKGMSTTRIDLRLEPPFMPFSWDMYMIVEPTFTRKYAHILEKAPAVKAELEQAIYALQAGLDSGIRNRYNLEVLLSIAHFEKNFAEMLLGLQEVERLCIEASKEAYAESDPASAVSRLRAAHSLVARILEERKLMWRDLKAVWERSRYEKGRSVAGRKFVHVLDDLKDHFADRRPGLEYMLAPYERMGLEEWNRKLAKFTADYAAVRGL